MRGLQEQTDLIGWLAALGAALRASGVEVGTVRLQNALAALLVVDLSSEHDVYWALRCTLLSRAEHIEVFDALLARSSRQPSAGSEPQTAAAGNEGPRSLMEEPLQVERPQDASDGDEAEDVGLRASAEERLLELDLGSYEEKDLHEARGLIEKIAWELPRRTSRRQRVAGRGSRLDFRRTIQLAMRTGGHPLSRAWRSDGQTHRRIVLLLDVSGSMAAYSKPLMMFAQAAVRASRRVDVYSFGTRLTRLTEQLDQWDPESALDSASRSVPDWSGGTRIGENVRAFNETWGRRGVSRGAVMIVVSDGWERGDSVLLRTEMEKLARSAYNIVWVNPLAGDPEYEPLAAGMAAALRFVDVFLPGHNLRALSQLVTILAALPAQRGRARAGKQAVG